VVAVVIAVVTWAITPAIGVLAIFAAAGVALWAGIKLSLSTPALILEGQSVTGALRRSWALVTGSWWRVFGILLLATLVAGIIGQIIQVPFGLGQVSPFNLDPEAEPAEVTTAQVVLGALGTFVAGAVTGPVVALITALLYVDRRIRAEGFDLTLAMAARGETGTPAGGPPTQYGGQPPGPVRQPSADPVRRPATGPVRRPAAGLLDGCRRRRARDVVAGVSSAAAVRCDPAGAGGAAPPAACRPARRARATAPSRRTPRGSSGCSAPSPGRSRAACRSAGSRIRPRSKCA
jgi:hypothetical protein